MECGAATAADGLMELCNQEAHLWARGELLLTSCWDWLNSSWPCTLTIITLIPFSCVHFICIPDPAEFAGVPSFFNHLSWLACMQIRPVQTFSCLLLPQFTLCNDFVLFRLFSVAWQCTWMLDNMVAMSISGNTNEYINYININIMLIKDQHGFERMGWSRCLQLRVSWPAHCGTEFAKPLQVPHPTPARGDIFLSLLGT